MKNQCFSRFCDSHIFLLFSLVAAMWITFSLQNGCNSLQIRVLGGTLATFWRSSVLPRDDIWALQLSTSLVWLPLGAKLCSQSPPRPFLKRFLGPNLEISSNFDAKIMRFLPDSNPSMPSNSPILQASNHPIIQVGTAECAERLNPPHPSGVWDV